MEVDGPPESIVGGEGLSNPSGEGPGGPRKVRTGKDPREPLETLKSEPGRKGNGNPGGHAVSPLTNERSNKLLHDKPRPSERHQKEVRQGNKLKKRCYRGRAKKSRLRESPTKVEGDTHILGVV